MTEQGRIGAHRVPALTGIRRLASQAEVAFTRGRRRRMLLFLVMVLVYLPTANYAPPMVNDNISMAAASWALGTTGNLDLSALGLDAIHWGVEVEGGRLYSNRFPGTFLIASVMYRILPVEAMRPTGTEGVPLWPATLVAVLVAAAAMVVLVEVLRRVVSPGTALAAGFTAALATPFWSVAANELWTHGPAILCLGLGVLALTKNRFGWAGAAFGYAILVRPTLAVVPLVLGLWAGVARRSIRPVVLIGVTSALGLAALSIYSRVLFGTWWPVAGYGAGRAQGAIGVAPSQYGGFTLWEQLFGTFFDTYRGVLVFTPFLAVLVPAVRAGWRAAEWWVKAAAVAGILVWVVQLRANGFPGGSSFWGYRLALEPLLLMTPLLVSSYSVRVKPVRLWRFATLTAVAGAFAIILPGAMWYGTKDEPVRPQYVRTTGEASGDLSHDRDDETLLRQGGSLTSSWRP